MTVRGENSHDICKQVYNCLTIPKGSYAYNKELGSDIIKLDINAENAAKTCELMVRDALRQVPQVMYEGCIFTKESETACIIKVMYKYLAESFETEVNIYG